MNNSIINIIAFDIKQPFNVLKKFVGMCDKYIALMCVVFSLITLLISPLRFQYELLYSLDPKLFLQPHDFWGLMRDYFIRLAYISAPLPIVYIMTKKSVRNINLVHQLFVLMVASALVVLIMYRVTHRHEDLNANSAFYRENHHLSYNDLIGKALDDSIDITTRKRALLLCTLFPLEDNADILNDLESVRDSLCEDVQPHDLCITLSFVVEFLVKSAGERSAVLLGSSIREAMYQTICLTYFNYEVYINAKMKSVDNGGGGTRDVYDR